jgi:hypothetical protein
MPKPETKAGTNMRPAALRRAQVASTIVNVPLIDFISDATDKRSIPLLKKSGVILPADAEPMKS